MPGVDDAIKAIGHAGAMDWDLKPETHAASLPEAAGPLKRILEGAILKDIINAYNQSDTTAKAAQTHYKRLARIAALTSFAAVVLGGILLLPRHAPIPAYILTTASIIQVSLLVCSFVSSLTLAFSKPFNAWMHARAEAETARIGLFNAVLAADEQPRSGELDLLPLQLEYLRRYQLNVQRAYYKLRGAQHARAVKRAGLIRIFGLLLVALAAVPLALRVIGPELTPEILQPVATYFSKSPEAAQRIVLAMSVVGGALQGALAAYALMSQDERNAARYLDTSQNLEDLAGRPLDEARAAASENDRESVLAFAALLHEQISSEHREWIALRSVVPDLALGKLKAAHLPRLR